MTTGTEDYPIHPAATIFPEMTRDEYEELKKDISENGQREPITIWNGKLIDGSTFRACRELGRSVQAAELDWDQDPWSYVVSYNLHRRHMTTSERAAVAAKLANLKNGTNQHDEKVGGQRSTHCKRASET